MKELVSAAGRAFLRAFVAALIIYGIGISTAPQLHQTYLIGVSAILGAFGAGIRALQAYVPALSFVKYLGHPYGDWVDSFAHGFLGSLLVTLPGAFGAPDLNTVRSLVIAAIIGAANAGLRALQGTFTIGEAPRPAKGLPPPPGLPSMPPTTDS